MLTRVHVEQLAAALEYYRMDVGAYPTSEQGLEALLEPSSDARGAYIAGPLPRDAWGASFRYASPGHHHPDGFDLWSLGADGAPGGEGAAGDLGNW